VAAVAAAASALAPDDGEGAAVLATRAERSLEPAARIAPDLEPLVEELRDVGIRLTELGGELHRSLASLEADPERLEGVEARLDRIAELRRRFRCETTDALLARRAEAVRELDELDGGLDPVASALRERTGAEERYDAVAEALSSARRDAAPTFAAAVEKELAGLGMGEGEFAVELRERHEGPTGRDEAVFSVQLNAGLPSTPLAETASGGELSRVALALAVATGARETQTLVFDEIDAGIGGQTAHLVADTLQRLGRIAQVVTITHLPQIASVADAHFRVEKVAGDPTRTQIELLDGARRRDELERMLGGHEFLAAVASDREE
jgi:DNA repair protein RecN (Recombination protein N)